MAYRPSDPRNTHGVWDALNMILKRLREIELIIDEQFCDTDDGMHWIRIPMEEE